MSQIEGRTRWVDFEAFALCKQLWPTFFSWLNPRSLCSSCMDLWSRWQKPNHAYHWTEDRSRRSSWSATTSLPRAVRGCFLWLFYAFLLHHSKLVFRAERRRLWRRPSTFFGFDRLQTSWWCLGLKVLFAGLHSWYLLGSYRRYLGHQLSRLDSIHQEGYWARCLSGRALLVHQETAQIVLLGIPRLLD